MSRNFLSCVLAVLAFGCSEAGPGPEWVSLWPAGGLPADSPYWWSVSPDVSPQELRATLLDRSANEERYRRAEEAGIATLLVDPEPPDDEEIRRLVYVHPDHDPELVPLWISFRTAAEWAVQGPGWDQDRGYSELRASLIAAGMSDARTDIVEDVLERRAVTLVDVRRTVDVATLRFRKTLRRAAFFLGKRDAERATYLGHVRRLSMASFSSLGQVREDRLAYLGRQPLLQVELDCLVDLRSRLTQAEWDVFRRTVQERGRTLFVTSELRLPAPRPLFVFTHRLLPALLLAAIPIALLLRRKQETSRRSVGADEWT